MSDLRFSMPIVRGLQAASLARMLVRRRRGDVRAMRVNRARFYSEAWEAAAVEIGASYEELGAGVARIELGGARTCVSGMNSAIDDPVTLELAGNKPLTYKLLGRAGIPTPAHLAFGLSDLQLADDFLRAAKSSCVVKPASGTGGGRAVTTGVRTAWQLVKAAAAAAIYGDQLIIEKQIAGDNYRLLYLDGTLLHAFVRKPPQVIGDGKSSVAQLVSSENKSRVGGGHHLAQVLLSIDADMRHTLASQGMSLRSVPPTGRAITLKTVVNQNSAADNLSATHLLCSSVIETGARAAATLGVHLAGVDIVTPDPGISLEESAGVVLEVNTTPGFYFHYGIADRPCRVATIVLRKLLGVENDSALRPTLTTRISRQANHLAASTSPNQTEAV